jgi:hypothetical protein
MVLRYFLHIVLIITVSASASAIAAQPQIEPGEYFREEDSGTLTIRPREPGKLSFEIESVGGNCHSCSVSGVISGAIGLAESEGADGSVGKCKISFLASRFEIDVNPITQEECRMYCGARAKFDGTYFLPTAECTRAGRQKQRDSFLDLYRSRRFAKAAVKIQGLIGQCSKFMDWTELDQARNDLALAQYHNGEIQQCLATLNTTIAATVENGEELKKRSVPFVLSPCFFDNYIEVAKSIWFNKALCTKAMAR